MGMVGHILSMQTFSVPIAPGVLIYINVLIYQ